MAACIRRALICALWAFARLADAYSDISTELKNGRDCGYTGVFKIFSRTAVREKSDGVFEVNDALVTIKATNNNVQGHNIKRSISLYESKTDGPADWKEVSRLRNVDRDSGIMEFYAGALPKGKPVTLKSGYWYSIMFYSSRVEEPNGVVFTEPWQCPDLKPYTEREPVATDGPQFCDTPKKLC
ncbi:hypothetical protein PAPHI01_2215 [Pancytospora philotis]|nr:hypothetical protein PAPHI01_2215 [Pancytospora philotis]